MLLKNKKVLITGGLGFIGSHLAKKCLKEGAIVTIIDNLIENCGGNLKNIASIKDKLTINFSDINEIDTLKTLIKNKDYVFSLAGQSSHIDSMTDPFSDLNINVSAKLSLLEICRKINPKIKIFFASTRQIYGKPNYLPVDERHPINHADINSIHKYAAESYLALYYKVYGIKSCSLRLTNVYGPHMRIKDERQNFLGIWIKNILQKKPIEIWGSGNQYRDFNYISDCIDAFFLIIKNKRCYGNVYNIGAKKINHIDLANLLIKINGRGTIVLKKFPKFRKKIDIGDYYSSYTLFNTITGWKPKVSLNEGLKRTLKYYKKHIQHYI